MFLNTWVTPGLSWSVLAERSCNSNNSAHMVWAMAKSFPGFLNDINKSVDVLDF